MHFPGPQYENAENTDRKENPYENTKIDNNNPPSKQVSSFSILFLMDFMILQHPARNAFCAVDSKCI